ncbi:MAG: hypothetical protein IPJ75_07810 [Ignavibacteriales bacterium]|nr:hypothetical protein [Ignavibacteriales bacterium]
MKIFVSTIILLTTALTLSGCESPRMVFPDIDYGIVIISSDLPVYNSDSRDSNNLIYPGDRIKSSDTLIELYTSDKVLSFSLKKTINLFMTKQIDTGNQTIIRLTDKYAILKRGSSTDLKRITTELEFSDETVKSILWDQK